MAQMEVTSRAGALVVLVGARLVGRGVTHLLEGPAGAGVLVVVVVAGVVVMNQGECSSQMCRLSPGLFTPSWNYIDRGW